jgi:hypothetical protein
MRLRTLTLLLVLLFGCAYALFTQDPVSHNTLCRAAMTANLVQHGRVDINGYDEFTRDKAFNEGDYYCDKAPGMSFLAAPAAFAFTRVVEIGPGEVYGRTWTIFMYLMALTTSGALCLIAAVLLFHELFRRTGQLGGALVGALAFGLGTPVWGWATSMFSHAAAAALLVIGFLTLDRARRGEQRPLLFAVLAGLALGGAVAVEYTAFVPAVIIGAACALASDWRRPLGVISLFAASALAALLALAPAMAFHAVAFGSPFTTGYAYTVEFTGHHSGLFGIGAPRLDVIGALLVSPDRGLIWYAPVALAAAWAVGRMMGRSELRLVSIVTLLIAAWYLLMNAGFEYWEGGASTGPRYLTPALGFAAIALGLAWPLLHVWERRASVALLGLSIVINFACAAVDMTAGGLWERIVPSLLAGDLRHTMSYLVIGQPSLLHLALPLLAAAALGWLIWREARRLSLSAPA